MATLTGNKPKDTYKGLIKTIDSQEVDGAKQLSDGNGNALPIVVSTTEVRINDQSVKSFEFDQTTALAEWVIPHAMNKKPSVTVIDSTNRVVVGEVEYVNNNELIVRFKYAFKGKAILN